MKLEKINTGSSPNSGDADSIRLGFEKTNRNFEKLEKRLNIKLIPIIWNSIEDTLQCAKDINENFEKIENHINN